MKYNISLTIPHYNEEDNVNTIIPAIFKAFSKEKISIEIVAVDNGSKDNTLKNLIKLKKIYKRLKIISFKKNIGFGGGIIEGLKNCSSNIIGFTCADDQIKIDSILKVYNFFKNNNLDLVKTNRIKRHDGLSRVIFSRIFNLICRTIFNIKTRDINGYPVIMKKNLFNKLNLKKTNWMINTEILTKSRMLNARIGEIGVVFYKRKRGKTNIKIATLFDFLFQVVEFTFEFLTSKEYKNLRK